MGDNEWLAMVGDLGKSQKSWGCLSWVLVREGADPKVLGNFYREVAQAILLFRAETWVLNHNMEKALDSFHFRVAKSLTGKKPWRKKDGSWDYLPLAEALREAGLEGIRKSITRRQNMVAQYIVTQPILDLCERFTRRLGARVSRRCW